MVISGCQWNLISSNMACWEIPELAIEVYSWENHRKSTFLLPVGQFIKCPLRALRKQFFEHESALDYTHTQYTKLYISLHPRISSILSPVPIRHRLQVVSALAVCAFALAGLCAGKSTHAPGQTVECWRIPEPNGGFG